MTCCCALALEKTGQKKEKKEFTAHTKRNCQLLSSRSLSLSLSGSDATSGLKSLPSLSPAVSLFGMWVTVHFYREGGGGGRRARKSSFSFLSSLLPTQSELRVVLAKVVVVLPSAQIFF